MRGRPKGGLDANGGAVSSSEAARHFRARDEKRSTASIAVGWGGVWPSAVAVPCGCGAVRLRCGAVAVPCVPGGLKGRGPVAPAGSRCGGTTRASPASEGICRSDRERAEGFRRSQSVVATTASERAADSRRGGGESWGYGPGRAISTTADKITSRDESRPRRRIPVRAVSRLGRRGIPGGDMGAVPDGSAAGPLGVASPAGRCAESARNGHRRVFGAPVLRRLPADATGRTRVRSTPPRPNRRDSVRAPRAPQCYR